MPLPSQAEVNNVPHDQDYTPTNTTEPYSAQVLRRVFADKNALLQEYHDMCQMMECPKAQKIMTKVLQDLASHLDGISDHWKTHERYKDFPPLEGDEEETMEEDEEDLDDEDKDKNEEELAEESLQAPVPPLADPNEVGETMKTKKLKSRTKDMTKDEAEDIKDDIDKEVADKEGDEMDEDEEDLDDEDKDRNEEDEEEEGLDDNEKEAVAESSDFMKSLTDGIKAWGDEERFKAFHYHKLLANIGTKAKEPKIYGVHGPADVTGVSDAELREHANRQIRNEQAVASNDHTPKPMGNPDAAGTLDNDDPFKALKALKAMATPPTLDKKDNDKFHKSLRQHCKELAEFMKELSGTRYLEKRHREKGMTWHKDIEDLMTAKDDEEHLPEGKEEDSQDELVTDLVGEMGEKGLNEIQQEMQQRNKTLESLSSQLNSLREVFAR